MRHFTTPTRLERLSPEARLIYSFFCVFMLLGYATSAWLYADDDLGTTPSGAASYYLGEAESDRGPPLAAGASTGPELRLPDELDAKETEAAVLRFEKPRRQVVETFHFHLFTVPVCFLIIAHIFMMTALPQSIRLWTIGLGGGGTLVHLLTPPLIRFASADFAALMFPSAVVMGVAWLFMTIEPLVEMWRSSPRDE